MRNTYSNKNPSRSITSSHVSRYQYIMNSKKFLLFSTVCLFWSVKCEATVCSIDNRTVLMDHLEDYFSDPNATHVCSHIESWDVSDVTDFTLIFSSRTSFNADLSYWNTSSVTSMFGTFSGCSSYNRDLSNWDTSKVTSMWVTFSGASSFNGDISTWNTSSVTSMLHTFNAASSFNGNLSAWDTSNVTDLREAFRDASSFNGDISNWDISKVSDLYYTFLRTDSLTDCTKHLIYDSWSAQNHIMDFNYNDWSSLTSCSCAANNTTCGQISNNASSDNTVIIIVGVGAGVLVLGIVVGLLLCKRIRK